MAAIDVRCEKVAGGWTCEVEVASGPDVSKYRVHVASVDLARLAPAADGPQPLVRPRSSSSWSASRPARSCGRST
jgi:hypothetical protein